MWIKGRDCDSHACVEVWPGSTRTWVRDSTRPSQVLSFSNEDYVALVGDVKRDRFDRTSEGIRVK